MSISRAHAALGNVEEATLSITAAGQGDQAEWRRIVNKADAFSNASEAAFMTGRHDFGKQLLEAGYGALQQNVAEGNTWSAWRYLGRVEGNHLESGNAKSRLKDIPNLRNRSALQLGLAEGLLKKIHGEVTYQVLTRR